METTEVLALTEDRPRRTLAPDELLIHAEQEPSALYVLEAGVLAVERDGRPIATVDEPGSVLGEMGLLLDVTATADVRSEGEAVVRVIHDVEQLFAEVPQFARYLATMLARRLHRMTGYLDDLQRQFGDERGTLALVPRVLGDLMADRDHEPDPGSDREPEAPY